MVIFAINRNGKSVITAKYLKNKQSDLIIVCAKLKIQVENLMTKFSYVLNDYETLLVDSDNLEIDTKSDDYIREQLKKPKLIIFTTFKSAINVISELMTEEDYERSSIIIDEVHNIVGNDDMCDFVNKFYDGILMSATIPEELYEIVNCVEGFKYTLSEAIKNKYCLDYKIWLPSSVNEKCDETLIIENNIEAKINFLIVGMMMTGAKKCIVYLSSQLDCEIFNDGVKNLCSEYYGVSVWCSTIISGTKNRTEIIDEFEENTARLLILTSVMILNEAVDILSCDSTFITHVGDSENDIRFVQRLSRGATLNINNPNKENHCFIWVEELSKSLGIFSLLREEDVNFSKKIKTISTNYNETHLQKNQQYNLEKTDNIVEYIDIKCVLVEERILKKTNLLIEFVEEFHRVPKSTEEYNTIKIGQFWSSIKYSVVHIKIYKDILSKNDIIRQAFELFLKEKEERNKIKTKTPKEKADILLDFVIKNSRLPKQNEEYVGMKVGQWWSSLKCGDNRKIYEDILIKNDIIRQSFELFLKEKEERNKIKTKTPKEKAGILLDFVIKNSRLPTPSESNKINISQFWSSIKAGIVHRKIYEDILSKNDIIKQSFELFLKEKEERNKIKTKTPKEKADILLDFVIKKSRIPKKREEYAGVKVGHFLTVIKLGVHIKIYEDILSKNDIIRQSFELFLKRKNESKKT